jgi:hypothetical protein
MQLTKAVWRHSVTFRVKKKAYGLTPKTREFYVRRYPTLVVSTDGRDSHWINHDEHGSVRR